MKNLKTSLLALSLLAALPPAGMMISSFLSPALCRRVEMGVLLSGSLILLALAIGIILARTLLQHRRSRWQQSPYLLTANTPLAEGNTVEDDEEDAPEAKQEAPKKG